MPTYFVGRAMLPTHVFFAVRLGLKPVQKVGMADPIGMMTILR